VPDAPMRVRLFACRCTKPSLASSSGSGKRARTHARLAA